MKRIFLHAGHFKTATTSAQNALAAHRAQLSERGILYPSFEPLPHQHGALLTAWEVPRPPRQKEMWAEQAEAWRGAPEHSIILSAETAANFSRKDFAEFRESFSGFDITLVFTLRHWAGFAPSRWQQYVRRGDGLSLPDYLRSVNADFDGSIDGDVSLPMKRAHGVLDRMVAVPYEAGNALRRLYEAFEIPADLSAKIIASAPRDNESMQFLPRECIRLYNLVFNEQNGLANDMNFRASIDMSIYWPPHRMRRLLLKSEAPAAKMLREILSQARQEAPRSRWADLFTPWTQRLNAKLAALGLAPMPESWGADELEKPIAFTEIGLGDLPPNCLRGCRSAILRQPDVPEPA